MEYFKIVKDEKSHLLKAVTSRKFLCCSDCNKKLLVNDFCYFCSALKVLVCESCMHKTGMMRTFDTNDNNKGHFGCERLMKGGVSDHPQTKIVKEEVDGE